MSSSEALAFYVHVPALAFYEYVFISCRILTVVVDTAPDAATFSEAFVASACVWFMHTDNVCRRCLVSAAAALLSSSGSSCCSMDSGSSGGAGSSGSSGGDGSSGGAGSSGGDGSSGGSEGVKKNKFRSLHSMKRAGFASGD